MLDTWTQTFAPDFLERVELALQDEATEEPGQSVVTAVTGAVMRTMSEVPQRVDWKFIVGIILTLVIFFYQEHESAATAAQLADLSAQVAHGLAIQDEMMRVLLTREVRRSTVLQARPKAKARVLARLPTGIAVVLIERKGKWTRIGVRADESPTGRPLNGWLLNKYLR